jgi:hypothetical protein
MSVPMRRLALPLILGAALGLAACEEDDSHKGSISHGSAAATTGAPAVTKVRLIYAPGSPLATMRVATAFTRRLGPLGVSKAAIKIGGEQIHVDVPADKAAAVKKALEGGRLDVYLFDDGADPFAAKAKELPEGFRLAQEKGSEGPVHFVLAPEDRRADLEKLLGQNPSAGRALVGPAGTGDLRSYYVEAESSVRGELLTAAKAEQGEAGPVLALTFEGSGMNLLRWGSKEQARFVVEVDGLVVGTAQAETEITDGVLRVVLARSGPDALEETKALAKSLAGEAGGLALSHLTVFAEERPLGARRER